MERDDIMSSRQDKALSSDISNAMLMAINKNLFKSSVISTEMYQQIESQLTNNQSESSIKNHLQGGNDMV